MNIMSPELQEKAAQKAVSLLTSIRADFHIRLQSKEVFRRPLNGATPVQGKLGLETKKAKKPIVRRRRPGHPGISTYIKGIIQNLAPDEATFVPETPKYPAKALCRCASAVACTAFGKGNYMTIYNAKGVEVLRVK